MSHKKTDFNDLFGEIFEFVGNKEETVGRSILANFWARTFKFPGNKDDTVGPSILANYLVGHLVYAGISTVNTEQGLHLCLALGSG